jgi:5-methylcytosine-specific restriction protein B
MSQEVIDRVVSRDQAFINSEEFCFQKGQDALQSWLNLQLTPSQHDRLLTIADDYDAIQLARGDAELNPIIDLLYEVIAYCDQKAKDKILLNKYNDKRTLAAAAVRMNSWFERLIALKLKPTEPGYGSTRNAFDYLLNPITGTTILSENHRKQIANNLFKNEYKPERFVADLVEYFARYNIKTANPQNYTQLLSAIIYEMRDEWIDEVVGLMTSDSTGWQTEFIDEMEGYKLGIVWNSKRPSGTGKTLKFLRDIIDEGETFYIYYASGGMVRFRATIVDFVESQNELDNKNWVSQTPDILYYRNQFAEYRDNNKSATIVFLTSGIEGIEPVPMGSFEFYGGYDTPRQDNMSPIKVEPESVTKSTPVRKANLNSTQVTNEPLNQILYGPPGTGKTYTTIEKAARIISNSDPKINWNSRSAVKAAFDLGTSEGRIVFTTFHQSMSYEEFLEGLKPIPPTIEGNQPGYKVVDGVFKAISKLANDNRMQSQISKNVATKIPFDAAFEILEQKVESALLEDPVETPNEMTKGLVLHLSSSFFSLIAINGQSIRMMTRTGNTQNTMTKPTLRSIFEDLGNMKKYVSGGMQTYYKALVEEMYTWTDEFKTMSKNSSLQNYVIIIDEINRGNISQIFGELITLIEEDKRLGKDEAIQLTLPYSRDKFGVPLNLYIIGTMNTADRSVEALDSALRRRFSFYEIGPDANQVPEVVGSIPLRKVFEVINQRLTWLLDSDHQIGHAYFCERELTEEKLKGIFRDKVLPLLKEYFFSDYDKIRLVLGASFVRRIEKPNFVTSTDDIDRELILPALIDGKFDIVSALQGTIN